MQYIQNQVCSLRLNTFSRVAFFCLVCIVAACLAAQPAYADTHTVTNTLDAGDGSLRQAIDDATSGDIIVFDTSVFSAPLTITLTSGQLVIAKSLTIDGAAGGVFTPTVSGNNASRVFLVGAGVDVQLNQLSIVNGNYSVSPGGAGIYSLGILTVTNSLLANNTATNDTYGGGIYNDSGASLFLVNSLIAHNSAPNGGGVANGFNASMSISNTTFMSNTGESGGAIMNVNANVLIVEASEFTGNHASNYGGAINNQAPLLVSGSTFDNNTSVNGGGAIQDYSVLHVQDSLFTNNIAGTTGGAINISQGTVVVTNSTFMSNSSTLRGGGISNHNQSALWVTGSSFVGNKTSGPFASGGGIVNEGNSKLTVTNSTFDSNTADYSGGAIRDEGHLSVEDSYFKNNSALNDGGGLSIASPGLTVYVTSSMLLSNSSFYGGGIVVHAGALKVMDGAFVSNNASSGGGGLSNLGGAIVAANSTFVGNRSISAVPGAGGIYNCSGACVLTVTNSTIVSNTGPTGYAGGITNDGIATLTNTIVANNANANCSGNGFIDSSHNLDSESSCGFSPANSSLNNANPLLSELGDYGGPVPTIPLLPGSPAIDAGVCDGVLIPTSDARGVARPQGEGCDIGAFESRGFTFGVPGGTPQAALNNETFAIPLSVSVTSAYSEPVDGGLVTFDIPSTGASATLQPASPVTLTGGMVTTTATANAIVGSYTITASARGVAGSVYFSLTNQPAMYSLTVDIVGAGVVSTNPEGPSFASGTVVTLTATPAVGSSFAGWSANCALVGNDCVVTMTANTLVTATFSLNTYTLTTAVSGSGIVTPNVGAHPYLYGTVVTLTAMPAVGWSFAAWSANCTLVGNDCVITITADTLVTATFNLNTYILTTAVSGSGVVTPEAGTHPYLYGTVVTVTATPDVGWSFAGWSDNCTLVGNECVVTMTGNTLVTATFNLNTYTLTMAVSGSGVVTPEAGTHTYLYGTVVTLTAAPQSGWGFVGWSGDLPDVGATNPVTILITDNKVVTATFSALPVADAGISQTVKSKSLVALNGSGSVGTHLPLTYQWMQSGGEAVVLNSATISMPVFTAPGTITLTQYVSFTLVVTDELGFASEPSYVVITVEPYRAHLPVVYKP